MTHTLSYHDWIAEQAERIGSDGCSHATGAYRHCCLVHDLSYYFAKDPVLAYNNSLRGIVNAWELASPITKSQADTTFRRCMQSWSTLGRWSPMSWWRFAGVKFLGGKAWKAHRNREEQQ